MSQLRTKAGPWCGAITDSSAIETRDAVEIRYDGAH
jgi:hypothetical protein